MPEWTEKLRYFWPEFSEKSDRDTEAEEFRPRNIGFDPGHELPRR